MITVRRSGPADTSAVGRVVTDAFGDDGRVAGLVAALRARPDAQADLVAEHGGRIVGHTHVSTAWVDDPQRLVAVAVLSPLSVVPDRQREGIGTALLNAAVVAAADLGVLMLFLEGDPAYYGRRGWQPAGHLGFRAPSARIPPAAFQVRPLPRFMPGSVSGALVYNDTFWSYDCVGLR